MLPTHVNYQAIETELTKEIRNKLRERLKNRDGSSGSGIRSSILRLVVDDQYEQAIEELASYIDGRAAYLEFQVRTKSYVQHSSELILAIQNKRNLPGLGALSLAKRQELSEKVVDHYEDLKHTLKMIEKVERDVRLTDARSTIWFIQAGWYAIIVLFVVAILLEINVGTIHSFRIVTEVVLDHATGAILRFIGF